MAILTRVAHIAGGAALTAIVAGLGKKGYVHNCAVKATAAGMRVANIVKAVTQDITDEACDVSAEARRQAKIDAAVRDRLADIEEEIRAEIEAQMAEDGVA